MADDAPHAWLAPFDAAFAAAAEKPNAAVELPALLQALRERLDGEWTQTTRREQRRVGLLWAGAPWDILAVIFSHLDVQSLARSACVCADWQHVARRESLWRSLYRRDFFAMAGEEHALWASYRRRYMERYALRTNWARKYYTATRYESGSHEDVLARGDVVGLARSSAASSLVACSSARMLTTWSMHSTAPTRCVPVDGAEVECVAFHGPNRIIAGLSDGWFELREAGNMQVLHRIDAHGGRTLAALAVDPATEDLFTVGADGVVNCWEIPSCRLVGSVDVGAPLVDVKLAGRFLVCLSPQAMFIYRAADLRAVVDAADVDGVRATAATAARHAIGGAAAQPLLRIDPPRFRDFQAMVVAGPGAIFTGSRDGTLMRFDVVEENGAFRAEASPIELLHHGAVNDMASTGDLLVTVSTDRTVGLTDLKTGTMVGRIENIADGPIWSVDADATRAIIGSTDDQVILLDFTARPA